MSTEDSAGWVPVKLDGETVGRASIEYGVATVQLRPEMEARFRDGITRGLSVAPAAEEAGCICDYEHIEGAAAGGSWEILRTVWSRDPACQFPHVGGLISGGQSDLVPAGALRGCDGSAGCPAGFHLVGCFSHRPEAARGPSSSPAVPGVEVEENWGRNSYTFRAEPALIEAMRLVPPFHMMLPADVEGVKVEALTCAGWHKMAVPATVSGTFQLFNLSGFFRTAYCEPCAADLAASGRFTPDTEVGK